jgi:serine/threonine protein phosphatase 1
MKLQYIAIGDIHGCLKSIEALWQTISVYRDAKFVFVGDYIDRGPDSKGVIDFLIKIQSERNCVFLRGNHEQMLLDAIDRKSMDHWIRNGGDATLSSYGSQLNIQNIPPSHLNFIRNTKIYLDTEDYFFSHAGAPPDMEIEKSKNTPELQDYFLWGRDHLNALSTPWEKTVVFGHTPRAFPIRKPQMLGIDTGCVYDEIGYGKLTAVILPDEKFIEQKSLDLPS